MKNELRYACVFWWAECIEMSQVVAQIFDQINIKLGI